MKVLIADDEPIARRVLREHLEAIADVEITGEAATGPEAVEQIFQAKPDLVLLDMEMPGLDGYRVKDMIKPHIGAAPIIAYTVHVSEINAVRKLGFDGFLGKPLDNARFPDQLARILNGEPVWDRV